MRPTTSASNLPRRELCPGSHRMEAGLPEEDSEQSREGTLLHDYAAHPEYDRAMLKPNQRDLLELADTLRDIVKKQVEETAELDGVTATDFTEITLKMRDTAFTGTPDWLRYYDSEPFKTALVVDRKFGFNVVERAELNLQLRAYAVMASDYTSNRLDAVFAAIVQPRAPYAERITIAKYTPDDIAESRKEIKQILIESEANDAPLIPGEVQCRYCKAKLTCPAFRESMMLPAVITPDTALSKTAREAYLEQKLAELKDEELDKVLIACSLAKSVSSIAMDEARKRDYFQFGDDFEVRNVADVRKALALLSLAGLPKDSIFACVTEFGITKLQENLRKLHPTWSAKQANEWINKKLASVIERETRKGRIIRK